MIYKNNIPTSADGIAYIFQLIDSGEIKYVDNSRGHYYRVWAKEITKEELEADKANEAAERERQKEP